MSQLILFCLAVIGLTHIIVNGVILEEVRQWLFKYLPNWFHHLLNCNQCAGTWCGFFLGTLIVSHNPFTIFACGCAGSFLASLFAVVLDYLQSKTSIDIDLA